MKRIASLLIPYFLLLWTGCAVHQQPEPKALKEVPSAGEPESPLPTDPSLRSGTLQNGIRYFIRVNKRPEKRAELRLVVNAGSVLEDDDQQGLAHLAEHMAFNGTEHFEKQELVDYMESIGMRFGPDLNAYTSFDETVYMLKVPTDTLEMVEQGFQILEDWAHAVSFEDEEIEKERGVVIEEWRLGRGAEARMRDQQLPILFKDSRYADRLPIGQKAVLDTFQYETVRRFYEDWYRPDLMAVIAVGDFDPDWFEQQIREHFERLPGKGKVRERTVYPVPDHEETLVATASDPEATGSRVGLYIKQDPKDESTHQAYRESILRALTNGMLNKRLDELTRKPNAPYLYAFSAQGRFVRSKEVYLLVAGVQDNGIERGLKALLTEAERVGRHGFTGTELEREKKDALRRMEKAHQEREKTESRVYTSEYIRHFLESEPVPGIEYEYELYRRYLPGIAIDEVNSLVKKWLTDENRVILSNHPDKEGIRRPAEDSLLAIFEEVDRAPVDAYVDALAEVPLVPEMPGSASPRVISHEFIDELGLYVWELANGVRVLLKPTDFKNDEILFTAYSDGGTSLIEDEDYVAAMTAATLVEEGGAGGFDLTQLQKLLAGKTVRVSPFIGELTEGLSGSASPQDLETMFQLIYLYFTNPRKDTTAYLAYKERMRGFLENKSASPESAFRDTIQVTLAQYHHRARPWSVKLLDEMDLEASYRIYWDRFADAGDFTFIVVGALTVDEIRPLIERYLGSLPATGREETWRDVGIVPPAGNISKQVKKGMEPKSLNQIIFTGPFEWSRQNRYDLQSMAQAFRIKLREVLREDLGGTYGVGVWASPSHYPREEYRLTISFGCDPEKVQELTGRVFQEIDSLQSYGLTEKYLTKVKETQRRERETDLKENRFWLNILETYDYHGEGLLGILEYDALVENLDLASIQAGANRYFNTDNYVRVVLLPEE